MTPPFAKGGVIPSPDVHRDEGSLIFMPDKKQSAKRRLWLLAGIGVFLLLVELAALGPALRPAFRERRGRVFGAESLAGGWPGLRRLIGRAIGADGQGDDKQAAALLDAGGPRPPLFDDEHYPVMVMIDNSPEARPSHSGLSAAVIIYETLVEGGATRLAAVFAGAPPPSATGGGGDERVGPIRSIRPVFVDIASGFGALLWHAGGSPEALSLLRNSPITDLNEISYLGPRYFWRDYAKPRPHNLFTDNERMKLALADFAPKTAPHFQPVRRSLLSPEALVADTPKPWRRSAKGDGGGGAEAGVGWQWGAAPLAASSSPATTIAIDFSPGVLFDAAYDYDATAGNYARVMAGRPHVDRQTSAQITADNVIIQRVPAAGYYPSGYGRLIINVVGEGDALFFRDGRAFSGRWSKASRLSQTEWLTDDGTPFPLKPGTVWVEIIPGRRAVIYN